MDFLNRIRQMELKVRCRRRPLPPPRATMNPTVARWAGGTGGWARVPPLATDTGADLHVPRHGHTGLCHRPPRRYACAPHLRRRPRPPPAARRLGHGRDPQDGLLKCSCAQGGPREAQLVTPVAPDRRHAARPQSRTRGGALPHRGVRVLRACASLSVISLKGKKKEEKEAPMRPLYTHCRSA